MAEFRKCQDCHQPYNHDVTSHKAPIMATECQHALCRHCLTMLFDQADNEARRFVTAIKCPICKMNRSFKRKSKPNLMTCAILKELKETKDQLEEERQGKRRRISGRSESVVLVDVPDEEGVSNDLPVASLSPSNSVETPQQQQQVNGEEEDRKPAAAVTGRGTNDGMSTTTSSNTWGAANTNVLPSSVLPVASLPRARTTGTGSSQPRVKAEEEERNLAAVEAGGSHSGNNDTATTSNSSRSSLPPSNNTQSATQEEEQNTASTPAVLGRASAAGVLPIAAPSSATEESRHGATGSANVRVPPTRGQEDFNDEKDSQLQIALAQTLRDEAKMSVETLNEAALRQAIVASSSSAGMGNAANSGSGSGSSSNMHVAVGGGSSWQDPVVCLDDDDEEDVYAMQQALAQSLSPEYL